MQQRLNKLPKEEEDPEDGLHPFHQGEIGHYAMKATAPGP